MHDGVFLYFLKREGEVILHHSPSDVAHHHLLDVLYVILSLFFQRAFDTRDDLRCRPTRELKQRKKSKRLPATNGSKHYWPSHE